MTFEEIQTDGEGGVIYTSMPIPASHPDRLAAVGAMYGWKPPVLEGCRVLELGCADGGNLLPMADTIATASFVGIDVASPEIKTATATAENLELKNVRFVAADIRSIDKTWGMFDYILCHGVFSWTSHEVQEHVLRICAESLTPNGIAYVNYNTYPGGRLRGAVRDVLRFHAMSSESPHHRVKLARDAAAFYEKQFRRQSEPSAKQLAGEFAAVAHCGDAFLFHAYLDVVNLPIHFSEFIARASQNNLQYLADADTTERWHRRLPDTVEREIALQAGSPLQREQVIDFLSDRSSRYSLLVHGGHKIFDDPLTTLQQSRLSIGPLRYSAQIHPYPVATRIARARASSGESVPNLRHECLQPNLLDRQVLCCLDGKTDVKEIRGRISERVKSGELVLQTGDEGLAAAIQRSLERLAKHAMLLAQ